MAGDSTRLYLVSSYHTPSSRLASFGLGNIEPQSLVANKG